MPVMQRQESFNRFYQEFVVDEAPRCTEGGPNQSGICVYRNEHGRGCAIGIQPEFAEIYDNKFEESGIEVLYGNYPEVHDIIAYQDLKFFIDLQLLHDDALGFPHEIFISKLEEFASEFGVKVPA